MLLLVINLLWLKSCLVLLVASGKFYYCSFWHYQGICSWILALMRASQLPQKEPKGLGKHSRHGGAPLGVASQRTTVFTTRYLVHYDYNLSFFVVRLPNVLTFFRSIT
jgi:hypothetical protein